MSLRILLAGLLLPIAASAADLPSVKVLPVALAVDAAQAAMAACAAKNVPVTVSVVDRSGLPKLLLVGDGTGPLTPDFARRKAYTALALNTSTGEFAKRMQSMPDGGRGMAGLDPNLLTFPGGAPIHAGSELLAAIGVSGAPDPSIDQACADAGVAKIADALK